MNNTLSQKVNNMLPKFLIGLCVIEPLIDVARFFMLQLSINDAVLTLLRPLLVAIVFIFAFIVSKNRKPLYVVACIVVLLFAGHIVALFADGASISSQVKNALELFKIYLLPVLAVSLIAIMKENKECIRALFKGSAFALIAIALVEVLSVITNTDPHTYDTKAIGVLGWFTLGNAQSAILSILVAIVLAYIYSKYADKLILCAASSVIGIALLFFNGTRLCYASIFAMAICFIITLLIKRGEGYKRLILILALCLILCVVFYGESPMVKNIEATTDVIAQRQEEAIQIAKDAGVLEDGLICRDLDTLKIIYSKFLQPHIDVFGIERIAKEFNYSIDTNVINVARTRKIIFCNMVMNESSPLCKVFGLDFAKLYVNTNFYHFFEDKFVYEEVSLMTENDILGIYYLNGIVGLALYAAGMIYVGIKALIYVLKNIKKNLSLQLMGLIVAYCCGIVFSVLTCSCIRCTNASYFFAVAIALLFVYTSGEQSEI